MSCASWMVPVSVLAQRMPASSAGLWSLLQTAALASAELSLLPAVDDDLSPTGAYEELREAAALLEWVHPHVPITGAILDVGPAPLDDVNGCRTAISTLILAALRIICTLLDRHDVTPSHIAALARAVPLLASAQRRVIAEPLSNDDSNQHDQSA